MLVIGVTDRKGILRQQNVSLLYQLTEELWRVESVIDVDSLSTAYKTETTKDDIIIEPYLATGEEVISTIKEAIMKDEMVIDYLLNKQGTLSLLYAKQKPYFNDAPNEQLIIQQAKTIIEKYKRLYPHLEFFIAGGVAVGDAYKDVAMRDFKVLLPVMFLLIATLLFFFFKTIIFKRE
jgi:predicted RND superfamily exporter protein